MIPDFPEFEIGEVVTYCPYNTETRYFVVGYDKHYGPNGETNNYLLSSSMVSKQYTTRTIGKCIKESVYFQTIVEEASWDE